METTLTMRISIEINSIDEEDYEKQKEDLVQYLEDKGFYVNIETESTEDMDEEFDDFEDDEDDLEDLDDDDDDLDNIDDDWKY